MNRKKVLKYLQTVYDDLQEMCEEYGDDDEEVADVLAVLQSDVDSAKETLSE